MSQAQVEPGVKTPKDILTVKPERDTIPSDTIPALQDSTFIPSDTIPSPKGDIETTINYSAKDSIRASVDGKMIWLYGSAKIVYGEIELEAEEIVIDYAKTTLTAHGRRDSLGHRVGFPIFKNGGELYETKDITYNFTTKRASITEVVTQQGEGYVHGERVYKNERNEMLSLKNSYTTCNLEHPHFRIRSTKSKAIPKDKIVSGPFYFEFNDIPLPLILPFGMFPLQTNTKSGVSGIIFPSYGEERRRGFNLRGGGYFFNISDYVKLALTGDIYSKGGHAVYANTNYMKRYQYSGSANFTYSKTKMSDNIENPLSTNDFRLTWSHSPQSRGTGRFSASVNAATSTFNRNNNLIYGYGNSASATGINNTTTKLSSNVSYSTRFPGTPFSLGINMSHNQDLVTRLVDLPLPNLSLNMTNQYPFQRKDGRTGPLDNFQFGYAMTASNRITNNLGRLSPDATRDSIAPFNFENLPLFLKNSRKGIRHSIPISHSLKAFKYFTLTPSIDYNERWYFEKLEWDQIPEVDGENTTYRYVADTIPGFNRLVNYSFSTGLNTRIFGIYNFKQGGSVQAIRHVINPSIGFNYTPDFTKITDYFFDFQEYRNGDSVTVYRSQHDGFVYGSSSYGKTGSISLSIGNNVEMKVKNAQDTVARKVMLLNNLSIGTGYNLVADSFKLSPISINANTNILNNLININMGMTLDPYKYQSRTIEGRTRDARTDIYAWMGDRRRLGRVTNANLALSTNLNPKARKQEQESREKIANSDLPEEEKKQLIKDPNAYIDFEIPWSLNINYNLSYSKTTGPSNIIQTITLSGDLSLSEKWKIGFNSGYDIKMKKFTQTDLRITRDLHCWTMSFNWVPFGYFQSYNFTINVKSSILQDLKLERRKPFFDNL